MLFACTDNHHILLSSYFHNKKRSIYLLSYSKTVFAYSFRWLSNIRESNSLRCMIRGAKLRESGFRSMGLLNDNCKHSSHSRD